MKFSTKEIIEKNNKALGLIRNAKTVWISTDWHAIKYNKQTAEISPRKELKIIQRNCSCIKEDDLWIFLGDIMDSEVEKKSYIDAVLSCVNTDNKILLLGNNDRYESYDKWFTVVVNTILIPEDRVVMTHCPITNSELINIHGHIHFGEPGYGSAGMYWGMYGIKPSNHVNAFTYPFKPVSLQSLIKRTPKAYEQENTINAKPFTRQLVTDEIHDYKILRNYYDKLGA